METKMKKEEPMSVTDAMKILSDVQKWSRGLPDYINEVEERINMPYPLHVINCAITVAICCMEESELARTVPICMRECRLRIPTSFNEIGIW